MEACEGTAARGSVSTKPAKVTLRLQDIVTDKPPVGATCRLCRKLDVDCEVPLTRDIASGPDGSVSLDVMPGFNGYLETASANFGTGLHFFDPAIDHDQELGTIELLSVPTATQLAVHTGAAFSNDRGLLLLRAVSCEGVPMDAVQYGMGDVDAMRTTYYSVDGLPSTSATETDRDGYGGFVNVAPGVAAVTVQDTAKSITQRTISLLVRPGTVTYARLQLPVAMR